MARGQSALSPLSFLSPSSFPPFLWHRYTSLLGLLLLHLPLGIAAGQTVHTLYWNSTSPIFHSDDPLLVNMEGHKFTFDQVGRTPSLLSVSVQLILSAPLGCHALVLSLHWHFFYYQLASGLYQSQSKFLIIATQINWHNRQTNATIII